MRHFVYIISIYAIKLRNYTDLTVLIITIGIFNNQYNYQKYTNVIYFIVNTI